MKNNFVKGLIALFMAAPFLFGCNQTTKPICATEISLSETSKSITYDPDASEKESFTLTATVTPSNYNYGTISWSGGKSYDNEYVKLTPSADGKTCKVTANMVCEEGINVYAKINGESKELTATCEVKVLKKKIHATSIEFTDTTAKTVKVKESITIPYSVTPAINDDLISAVATDKDLISATPDTANKNIIITGKLPGTTTVSISCWDGEEKKCECVTKVTITVAEPASLNFTLGETVTNKVKDVKTDVSADNVFKINVTSNLVLSSTSQMGLKVTAKDQKDVDLTKVNCTLGLMKKGTNNWIFVGTASDAKYADSKEYTLEAGQDYYVIIKNNAALASNEYDIHVTMPASK